MIELFTNGGVAQLGERCVRNAETAGSNPVVSIFLNPRNCGKQRNSVGF